MPAISLEGISKKYRIYPRQRERLKEALSFGTVKYGKDFWALKNVDLKVEHGSILGILGRNGAGKSTLLRIISGALQPSAGQVRTDGQVMALQMGAGFNPEFTGRENAFMNGLILGIDRRKIKDRFEEIEELAELGEFMEQPVKTYSSGMRARLGFAVAATIEPEILLVDEALAVGDAAFRHMGLEKMREMRESGATIVFVSHSTGMIKNFCTEAILMHRGELLSHGDTSDTIDEYHALISRVMQESSNPPKQPPDYEMEGDDAGGVPQVTQAPTPESRRTQPRHGTGEARVQSVELLNSSGEQVKAVPMGEPLTVRVDLRFEEEVRDGLLSITVRNEAGIDIFTTNTAAEGTPLRRRGASERVTVEFTFEVPLKHGTYSINVGLSRTRKRNLYLDWMNLAGVLEVTLPSHRGAVQGLVYLPTRVEVHDYGATEGPTERG